MPGTLAVQTILSGTIALVFLVSAATKLIAVNYFHEYIYSTGWFSLNGSILLAHFIIAAEASIGMAYLWRGTTPLRTVIALSMLVGFTIVIIYLHFTSIQSDCFCFGRMLKLPFGLTLLKNFVLAALILWHYRLSKRESFRKGIGRTTAIVCMAMLLSFGWHFPYSRWIHPSPGTTPLCESCLRKFTRTHHLDHNQTMLLFLSSDCNYCQLTAKRVTQIVAGTHQTHKIVTVLLSKDQHPDTFYTQSESIRFRTIRINEDEFLDITEGIMPLIVLTDKGKVYKSYRYKDLDEVTLRKFLNTP